MGDKILSICCEKGNGVLFMIEFEQFIQEIAPYEAKLEEMGASL